MPFLLASSYVNGQKVSLNEKNANLEQVFQSIKKQTGYSFLYDATELIGAEKVTINVKDVALKDALDLCFKEQPLTYKIFEGTIVVKKKGSDEQKAPVVIKGTVNDEKGSPIPGASVKVKGTTTVAITDNKGNYSITVSGENSILVFSYIGFAPQEVTVGNQTTITVNLIPQDMALGQVVVVGYGTQKRSDITGSVSSVKMKDLEGTPLRSVDQALQGRVAGVSFVQNSGMPGGGSSVRIRGGNSINGSNEPLYVIDGVPVFVSSTSDGSSLNPLNTISPSDIESMEVLKDASATAIYGSRGGNGVVLITTKRGAKNRTNIALDIYSGFQNELERYKLLNAKQFETLANDASLAEGGPLVYDPALNPVSTDWQNELFRDIAPMQSYSLSASGGSDKSQYLATFNYFDQQGIIKSSDLERYSLRLNADYNISPAVKFGSSVTVSNVTTNRINAASLSSMSTTAPNLPIKQLDGSYTQFNNQGNGFNNPVALINGYENKNGNFRGLGNAYISAEIIKGLTVRTMWGLDAVFSKNNTYMPQSVYTGSLVGGDAEITTGRNLTWLNENTVNYNKTFGNHRFDILAGFTQQSSRLEVLTATAQGFLNDNTGSNNLGLGSQALAQLPTSSTSGWTLLSWLGRVNYAFKDRYLLTLTSRYDGSSRFGKNNRWGFFPSAAFAWRGIEEDFIKNLNVFSDLKVRASYGLTGNQEGIGNYSALDLWGASNYVFDGHVVSGITPTQISNQNLKWESTLQTDIGLEFGFFKNRLSFVIDAYHKKTRDLLLEVTVPASSGFTDGIKNVGSLENKGLEFTVNAVPLDGAFKWNTGFNISFNKNKVLDLGVEDEIIPSGLTTALLKVGQPVGNFLGYISNGLFQSDEEVLASSQGTAKPGDLRYIDFNGDGIINILDRRVMGNAQPAFFGGFNNSFSYKGFDFSFFLQFVYGNEIYNLNRNVLLNLRGLQNQTIEALDRWTPTHKNTNIPRASSTRSDVEANNTYIEDGSYLRLKNVQLAYTLPSSLTKRVKLQSVKIYSNVQNLLTFSNYSGLDPEVSRYASDNVRQGYDSGAYPSVRTITLGILAKF
ncbi:TonB-dependent receptor [Pedobacter planticolens]|nr:TonB-dependent receptor [Pedobacter planticolens]